jgi:hypothetical protein
VKANAPISKSRTKAAASQEVDVFEKGDDWLKWSDDSKLAYVSGYVHGQSRGFKDGCTVGEELYSTKMRGLPGEKCIAKAPTYSNALESYIRTITEYYRSYPNDRNVPVFKVLEGLSDGRSLTLRQMHEYFPSSIRK